MTRRRQCIVALALLVVAVGIGLPLWAWTCTELTVRRVLQNPTASLTKKELESISGYISGDFWHRAPLLPISKRRQEELVKVAVVRTIEVPAPYILMCIRERWDPQGSYAGFGKAVGRAILKGGPNAAYLLTCAEASGAPKLDPYVDVGHVMLVSGDENLVNACVHLLQMETLYEHRQACLGMLERPDLPPVYCKLTLLKRIRSCGAGAAWFADRMGTLVFLKGLGDARVNQVVSDLEKQIVSGSGG